MIAAVMEAADRGEAVVVIEGPDCRLEKRYAADVAQAIAAMFEDQAKLRGAPYQARVESLND